MIKKKVKIGKKGFTLVELLVTIAIISVIFGIVGVIVTNVINNSKEQSLVTTKNNILTSARLYTEEYNEEISWNKKNNTDNKTFTCVSINELINKDLIKKDVREKHELSDYVVVWKDNNGNIISEEFDTNGGASLCGSVDTTAKIPTSNKYCNNLIYDKTEQNLAVIPAGDENKDKFEFINNTGIDAGTYKVEAKLKEGYHWNDGSYESKYINCTIDKAESDLKISSSGSANKVGETAVIGVESNNVDGKIIVKSSNNDYFEVSIENNDPNLVVNKNKNVNVKFLSERDVEGYITITLVPKDTKNYYNNSVVYRIGNPEKKKVTIPTEKDYCKNSYYNGEYQNLIKDDKYSNASGNGIALYDTNAKEIGKYTVTARLKFGYIWTDNTTEDKTITCSIKRPMPTVTYDNKGGSGCTTEKVIYGNAYGELCTPTRTGYTFDSWNTKADGSGTTVTKDTKVTNFNNHTLYAQWSVNTYKVYYNGNGNTSQTYDDDTDCNASNVCGLARYKSDSKVLNNTLFEHATEHPYDVSWKLISNKFKKTGYSFAGWSTSSTGSVEYTNKEEVSKLSSKDGDEITLYAKWSAKEYTVTFDPNGGTVSPTSKSVTYDSTYETLPTPTWDGYTFDGWFTEKTGGTKVVSTTTVTRASNHTIYAHWTAKSYTVSYDANGGSGTMADSTATYNSDFKTRKNTFTRDGYTFNGWNEKADGTGTPWNLDSSGVYEAGKSWKWTYTKNITLFAQWTAKQYTATFDSNGCGTVSTARKIVTFGGDYGTLATLTAKTGYKFNGWYTSKTGGTKITSDTKVTTSSNHTLYAQCSAKAYTVTFDPNGGSVSTTSKSVIYDSTYGTLPTPTRDGYTFNGWYTAKTGGTKVTSDSKVSITANQTLYAQWTAKEYTVTFNPNGGSVSTTSKTVTYGSAYGTLPTPTRIKYTFTGWYTAKTGGTKITSSTKVTTASNHTLYARWENDVTPPVCYVSNITCRTWTPSDNSAVGQITIKCNEGAGKVRLYYGYEKESANWSTKQYTDSQNKKTFYYYFRGGTYSDTLNAFKFEVTDLNGNVADIKSFSSIDTKYIKEGSNVEVGSNYIKFPAHGKCPLPDA